ILAAALLIWRAAEAGKITLPLSDHFDAFLFLAFLLSLMMMYFRATRNLRGLSFFLLPMITVLLALGLLFAVMSQQQYAYQNIWPQLHVVRVVAGAFSPAWVGVGGAVHLDSPPHLKPKGPIGGRRWSAPPPLASIEKFNLLMVYLGFPLLTIAMATGFLRV